MKSLLFKNEEVKTGNVVNAIHDLQIDDLVRYIYPDLGRRNKVLEIISNICLDKEDIYYRQRVFNDLLYNQEFYNALSKECVNISKCYAEFDSCKAYKSKSKVKSDISISDVYLSMHDYANVMKKLLEIYRRLNHLNTIYGPSSHGLKRLFTSVLRKVKNSSFEKLQEKIDSIINSGGAFGTFITIDDNLLPDDIKYIVCSGKYTGEKFSLFKKRDTSEIKVEYNDIVKEDMRRLIIDSYNRVVLIIEDIFESLYNEIGFLTKDFIFYEFGYNLYLTFASIKENVIFPEINETEDKMNYADVKDPYLLTKYICEGYSSTVYGNKISLNNNSALVVGGNNTGKTVFLRMLGICQIFSQVGLFIPASTASTYIRNEIVTIFSGEEKDTNVGGRFEKEVIDIKNVIEEVGENSLVMINEIFQSTFAQDGERALFDILNYFIAIKVKWITVTHLLTIVDRQKEFITDVKVLSTTGKEEKYQIKEVK